MNKQIMPVNVNNIRIDTWGMSAEQFGAYFLILMDLWANGPMKYDDHQLAQITRLSLRKWLEIGPYILRFLIIKDGRLDFESGRHIGLPPRRNPLSLTLRHAIIRRDGFVCAYCGTKKGAFEIDHIHPVSRGGGNESDNLCVACKTCNRSKRDQLVAEWRQ